jgi:hypothetical protein
MRRGGERGLALFARRASRLRVKVSDANHADLCDRGGDCALYFRDRHQ